MMIQQQQMIDSSMYDSNDDGFVEEWFSDFVTTILWEFAMAIVRSSDVQIDKPTAVL